MLTVTPSPVADPVGCLHRWDGHWRVPDHMPAFLALVLLAAVYAILAIARLGGTAGWVSPLTRVGEWVALADMLAAWYLGFGILLNATIGKDVMPMFPRRHLRLPGFRLQSARETGLRRALSSARDQALSGEDLAIRKAPGSSVRAPSANSAYRRSPTAAAPFAR
jgi:hypothetical protein